VTIVVTLDAPKPEAPRKTMALPAWVVALGLAAVLGFAVWAAYVSDAGSEPAARAFCEAVRGAHIDDARALAMPQLMPYLAADAPTRLREEPQPHALAQLRSAKEIDFDLSNAGFRDDFTPFACYRIELEHQVSLWIILRKTTDTWQVFDLRGDEEPASCKSGP
jgi:hypothetical protein